MPTDATTAPDLSAAIAAYNQGRYQDCADLAQAGEDAPARQLLGLALAALDRGDEAVEALTQARRLAPGDAMLRLDLTSVLAGMGREDDAFAELEAARALTPKSALPLTNMGTIRQSQGRFEEAMALYAQAVALDPEDAVAHGNLGACLLGLERWRDGFAEYEWRLKQPQIRRSRSRLPLWMGGPIQGKHLLVTAEQGFGDMIQFARFLPALKAMGAKITLECPPGLEKLLSPLVDRTVTLGHPVSKADYQVPLLSLGQRLGMEAAAAVPYLPCPQVPASGKVGIVWTGKPVQGTAFQKRQHGLRHCPIALLEPLTCLPEVKLVSLQQAWASEELAASGLAIADISYLLTDFQATAEIVAGLELVITIDSAVAHLAGAMGKPVWLMLGPGQRDYRWQSKAWVPQARIFRCGEDGWPGLIAKVAEALAFDRALSRHMTGDDSGAEALYAHLLSLNPAHPQGACNLGQIRAHQGQRAEAEALYRTALAARPDFPEALNNLGALLKDQGRLEEAAEALEAATAARPAFPQAWLSLGNVRKLQLRFEEAVPAYDRCLALDPASAEALINRAGCHLVGGRLVQAVQDTNAAMALRPDYPQAEGTIRLVLMELGVSLLERGLTDEAEKICRMAADRYADDAETRFRLGNVYLRARKLDQAEKYFLQALELDPKFAPAHNNLCSIHLDRDEPAKALLRAKMAVELEGNLPDIHNNLGNAYRANGMPEAALASYGQTLALRPDFPQAFNNMGVLMGEMGLIDGSLASFQQAIRLKPDYAEVYSNMGNVLKSRRRCNEALAAYSQALEVRPDYHGARLNLAIGLLQVGRWDEGWEEYRSRWLTGALAKQRVTFFQPEWNGEPLEGKSILFYGEQGYGDLLQFVRYAILLKERGARVIVLCHKGLVRLFQTAKGVDEVRPFDDPPREFDYHLAMMSAPRVFATTPDSIPALVPYLAADPMEAEGWRKRLAELPGLKVGLVWSGDPRPHDLAANMLDKQRSMSLQAFAFLKNIPSISVVSLQKGGPSAQVKDSPFPITDWMEEITDFAATAALVDGLDLVVSVDTSMVHLAGAIGKPVWILSRFDGCWRWLLDREDTDWYPSARLFLQTAPNDWAAALAKLEAELRTLAAERP